MAGLYSRVLEHDRESVYGQLQRWNTDESQWLRRVSLVSLIHYTGKNAVFLPLNQVLPLIDNCLADEIRQYIVQNMAELSTVAFSRAIERRAPSAKAKLHQLRKGIRT